MWRKNGMPAILYPLPKIVKKFNTIGFSGGTTVKHLFQGADVHGCM
jgi:hypothetical protein